MKNLSLLIKPASGMCNLRCRYCFYCDLKKYGAGNFGVMNSGTMKTLVDRALDECGDRISFCFQGGEPTCAGLDYFREFSAYVNEKNAGKRGISYAIQTNGTLLDEEWASFLAKHRFLTGLSIDGPSDIHNRVRPDATGRGTLSRVETAWRMLRKNGVDTNILTVVTGESARHAGKVYRYLKKLGAGYLQFIACLDPLGAERGEENHSLSPDRYGSFLCDLFDLWIADYMRGEYVSIRQFDDWVHNLARMPVSTCMSTGRCGSYLVIEADGSAYPCDFYVTKDNCLGSVSDTSLEELMKRQEVFAAASLTLPEDCRLCPYIRACHGGCRRDRIFEAGQPVGNYYCEAYKKLFEHAWPQMMKIARMERSEYMK